MSKNPGFIEKVQCRYFKYITVIEDTELSKVLSKTYEIIWYTTIQSVLI